MSYKLLKPYTDDEYADFIIKYNHHKGLDIKIMDDAIYALEANEIMSASGEPIINPNYKAESFEKARLVRIEEIKQELNELDKKRIRAMCEPSEHSRGVSWLEYYNKQARILRAELAEYQSR